MRFVACLFAALLVCAPAMAADVVGVVVMHGKNPGAAQQPAPQSIRSRLEHDGMKVRVPDMPWSARRYIDGDWGKAMDEIAGHLASLKRDGATRLVLVGHSIGAAASLSYAATRGGVDAVVMMAPGHVPQYYYAAGQGPSLAVRASVDEARALVASGQGDARRDFKDNNQGNALSVRLTAKQYLSYFDPEGDAEMSVTAAKLALGIPVMVILGNGDPLAASGRSYIFEKLPANPKHQYLEVVANHLNTPQVARDDIAAWIKQALAP
jgi:pimeloyl-ACP methyl ester carboxylesterase